MVLAQVVFLHVTSSWCHSGRLTVAYLMYTTKLVKSLLPKYSLIQQSGEFRCQNSYSLMHEHSQLFWYCIYLATGLGYSFIWQSIMSDNFLHAIMTTIKLLLYSGYFKGEDFHKLIAIFVLEMLNCSWLYY